MGRFFASLIVAICFADLAHAEAPMRQASAAFSEGRFTDAATLAAAQEGDADALAFAARATLAEAMCGTSEPPAEMLDAAELFARNALAVEPDHIEARLQLAIAMSLRLRPMGLREAMGTGDGGRTRELAEAVIADDPGNSYAHGFLAVWHLEVVRRGGRFGARLMDASLRDGLAHYARAAEAAPGDAALHWQVARALAALNVRRYRAEIDAALTAALAAPIDDRLEAVMADRAARLQAALATQSRRDVERLAEDML